MSRTTRKAPRRRAGRGATLMIAALLLASAGMRTGLGVGEALAQAGATPTADPPATVAEAKTALPVDGVPASATLKDRAGIAQLLEALSARETRIADRERQLEVRRKALEVTDQEVRERLTDLARMEDQLRQTLTLADGAAEDDLTRLTTVYESMKPKNAAALFETMEPAFAAGFLGRMRPDAAAAVMAGLTPESAYSISVIMAGRNAKAPKT